MKAYKFKNRTLLMAAIALLLVCTIAITAFAGTDLSVGISGLSASTEGATAWTVPSTGSVKWEGTTTSSGGCTPTYTAASGTLTLTNNSDVMKKLTFTYSVELNGGSLTINEENKTAGGTFVAFLTGGTSITISAASSTSATNTTKVTITEIALTDVKQVTTVFKPAVNGSYTVDGSAITESTSMTNEDTKTYTLVARPADNYMFAGWYLNDILYSMETSIPAALFDEGGTVTARFAVSGDDPLYKQATVPYGSYTKDQLVDINSYYLHDGTSSLVVDQKGYPANNSYYTKTSTGKIKDACDIQYVPSLVWNDSMMISASGTAMGDYVTGESLEESYSRAQMISDVIRIYAKKNCTISFNYTNSMSGGNDSTTNCVYYYITSASSATIDQVKTGNQLTGTSGSSGNIALSAGNYLYIVIYGYTQSRDYSFLTPDQKSMDYSYNASISGFAVAYNEKKDILTAGFRDNTGKALGSGTIVVNSVGQAIGTNGNMADMTFADQAAVTLAVSAAPANYVHIGWAITPEGGATTYQYTSTYTRTLKENVTVNAIFVPKTIITMGANGYSDATYTDAGGTALSGQYVARNASCTAYYTSLADAFSQTDVVVLLAGATINGDWEIPSGKTFVIPYGMNDKGNTTPDLGWGMGTDYCLVNLNGNLNVAGTLIVSAVQNQSTGATGGNPGHLVVASGKVITVSGSLYAYGPITGSGSIETTNTAKIHETMEFADNAPVMYIYNIYNERSSKKVFPFNAMFVNSIEIPVTYQKGATLTGHAAVRYDTTSTAAIPIIAPSGAMINMTSGSITKYFDHSTGQFVLQFNKDAVAESGSFSIPLTVTVAGRTMDITMDSAEYYIPFSSAYRFDIEGQFTFNGKYKLLPGMTIDVKEGGKLYIAEGSEVILYRRNDYDYRGKHANSTEQWGYGERAYPINPQRYNGVSYPFTFSNSNMGSTKLNVDGELIVNGGLYVTNEVQTDTANGLTLTTDGYNYLTGFGSIDMSNAATSLTAINEVMRASGTNDLAWDTVAVVPLKGLKADATADEAAQYESLNGKKVNGSTNANGLNVWSVDPCAGGHTQTAHSANPATCTAKGNSAYWSCSVCGKFFSDEACTKVIAENSWVIPAKGHQWSEATCTAPKTCSVCSATEGEMARHDYQSVVTPPTCTVAGFTTYTCASCGDTYTGDVVEANGHHNADPVVENRIEPGCTTDGSYDSVVRCRTCGEEISRETVILKAQHTYTGNSVICTVCHLFEFRASNIRLGNNLDMLFAFPNFAPDANLEGCYVKIVRTGEEDITIPVDQWRTTTIDGVDCYYVIYSGFAAKEMCDEVTVTVHDSTGKELSTAWVDSIRAYCDRMLLKYNTSSHPKLVTLIADMLNYGAACQVFFEYNTGNLANANLSVQGTTGAISWSQNYYKPVNSHFFGCNLIADSNSQFVVGFTTAAQGKSFTYTLINHWDKEVERTVSAGSLKLGSDPNRGQFYYHGLLNLRIADARLPFTVTIDGNSWTDSVESYCRRMTEAANAVLNDESATADAKTNATKTIEVMTAFMRFSDAAKAYLHSTEVVA